MKLSSAFINPREDGQFEWTATVYNINYGHNQKLLDACVPLKGYSILISKYRAYSNHLSPENAMRKAVDECIKNNILTDVLKEQRTSAMLEALTTYNKKAYEEGIREEGREEMRLFFADELLAKESQLSEKESLLSEKDSQLSEKDSQLSEKDNEIAALKAELERLTQGK